MEETHRCAFLSYLKHCVIMPYHIEQLHSVYRHSELEVSTAYTHSSGCAASIHTDMSVDTIQQYMDEDRHWAEHTGISGSTVLHILRQDSKMLPSGCHII